MSPYASSSGRRFFRSADQAILGGVCAGVADYFGFNLRVTRILTVIAFFMATLMTVVAYIAIVVLVPARPLKVGAGQADPEFRKALRSSPTPCPDRKIRDIVPLSAGPGISKIAGPMTTINKGLRR